MALRINQNVAALNSWRNLKHTDGEMAKTLEKLSSGFKVNRAADGPAALVISEQMRAQIKSLEQAIGNSEIAVSMVQTTEGALNEVNSMLVKMRQLAIHAANEGVNDQFMLAADQAEIDNSLETISRIARQAQFGTRFLLDGSNGSSGVTVGDGLKFIRAAEQTQNSPAEGFKIDVSRKASKSYWEGRRAMSEKEVKMGGIKFTIAEGGRNVAYEAKAGDTMEMIASQMRNMIEVNQLKVDFSVSEEGNFRFAHQEPGSEPSFSVVSSAGGLFSERADVIDEALRGEDIEGTIGGELAYGKGEFLTAAEGAKAEGVTVKFNGEMTPEPPPVSELEVKFDVQGNMIKDNNGKILMENKTTKEEVGYYSLATDESGTPTKDDKGDYVLSEPPETHEGFAHIANNSLMFQVGPNGGQTVTLSLPNTNATELSKGVDNESGFRSLDDLDITGFQKAQDALLLIDAAIDTITTTRGKLGAFQKNTLESNLSNMRYSRENLISAESSIRDTDMAAEMSVFTKNQILMASGTAMLAQANQSPRAILSLLNTQ